MKFELRKSVRNMAKAGVLAGSLLGLSMVGQSANAAQGTVDIDVTVPSVVILYYYSDINIDMDATLFVDAITGDDVTNNCVTTDAPEYSCDLAPAAGLDLSTGNVAGDGTIVYDADILGDASLLTNGSLEASLNFEIENAWAVRSTAPSLTASVANTSGEFTAASTDTTAPTSSMQLGSGNVGNILFTAPVNDTTLSDNTLSGTVTITVTAGV